MRKILFNNISFRCYFPPTPKGETDRAAPLFTPLGAGRKQKRISKLSGNLKLPPNFRIKTIPLLFICFFILQNTQAQQTATINGLITNLENKPLEDIFYLRKRQ